MKHEPQQPTSGPGCDVSTLVHGFRDELGNLHEETTRYVSCRDHDGIIFSLELPERTDDQASQEESCLEVEISVPEIDTNRNHYSTQDTRHVCVDEHGNYYLQNPASSEAGRD